MAAANVLVARMLDDVESKIGEAELEADDYVELLMDTVFDGDAVAQVSSKMHNLSLNLVRRCRGRHGLLAWKKLCASRRLTWQLRCRRTS